MRGVRSALSGPRSLGAQIATAVQAGGDYRFLRIRKQGDKKRLLFRLLLADDEGLNYHELPLAKRPDGKVVAIDIYVYMSGETLSTTVRRMYLPLVAKRKQSSLARLAKKETDLISHIDKLQRMQRDVSRLVRPRALMHCSLSVPGRPIEASAWGRWRPKKSQTRSPRCLRVVSDQPGLCSPSLASVSSPPW